jgi:hypothetical protein
MRKILNDRSLNIEPLQTFDEDSGLDTGDIEDIKSILIGD